MQLCSLILCFPVFLCLASQLPAATASKNYSVKPGDTLYSVAKRNGISVEKLKAINGISSNILRTGKSLKVQGNGSSSVVAKKKQAPVSEPKTVRRTPQKLEKKTAVVGRSARPASNSGSASVARNSPRSRAVESESEGDVNPRNKQVMTLPRKPTLDPMETMAVAEDYDRDAVVLAQMFLRAEGVDLLIDGEPTTDCITASQDYLRRYGNVPRGEAALIEVIARAYQCIQKPYTNVRVDAGSLDTLQFARKNVDGQARLSGILARQSNMSETLLISLNPSLNFDSLEEGAFYRTLSPLSEAVHP